MNSSPISLSTKRSFFRYNLYYLNLGSTSPQGMGILHLNAEFVRCRSRFDWEHHKETLHWASISEVGASRGCFRGD